MASAVLSSHNFKDIVCKLGNMRKAQEWTLYPHDKGSSSVTIQCENRIAKIDLETGKGIISDGKGGHQGFVKLMPMLGAKTIDVPAEVMAELKRLLGI